MAFGFVGLVVIAASVDLFESRWGMAVGLYLLGMGVGVWDVAMNLEGAAVERLLGKNVMPHFHAAFSGGTVLSALVGAGMSWGSVPLLVHFAIAIVASAVLGRVGAALVPAPGGGGLRRPRSRRPPQRPGPGHGRPGSSRAR